MPFPLLAAQAIGQIAGAIPTIISEAEKLKVAKEQKARAKQIEKQSENVLTRPIPELYKRAQEQREINALAGMPNYEASKQDIEAQTANTLRRIKEGGTSASGAAADAIAGVLASQNRNLMTLKGQQAQFKFAGRQTATEGMQGLGDIQERLEAEKRQEQARLRAASEALFQAGTINRQGAIKGMAAATIPIAKTIGMAAGGAIDKAVAGQTGTTAPAAPTTTSMPLQTDALETAPTKDLQTQDISTPFTGMNLSSFYPAVGKPYETAPDIVMPNLQGQEKYLDSPEAAQKYSELKAEGIYSDAQILSILQSMGFKKKK